MQLPNAIHLRCFRHFRANISAKLTKICIPPSLIKDFLKDIFGWTIGDVHEAGLVDATSDEDFDAKLESYNKTWDQRELAVNSSRPPTFFKWFADEKAPEIKESTLLPVREAAGLGYESLNSVLHEKVHYKASECMAQIQ